MSRSAEARLERHKIPDKMATRSIANKSTLSYLVEG
jgi:hypothetical protein